jgi:membrane-bound lytic murein transglycosylase B
MTRVTLLAACVLLCSNAARQQAPPQGAPPTVATQTASPSPAPARQDAPVAPSFEDWLLALRAEAISKGIKAATLDVALAGVQPDPAILARDRAQPELTQTLDDYIAARMTPRTLAAAADAALRAKTALASVEAAYGVPAAVMVAIWGLESQFGAITGTRPTVAALATLAFDSRRPALFRAELFEALRIIDRGLVAAADLKGSWAGAIGQPQFMPSSFLRHAVDFDADGRIDLWTSEADVLGSMAKYLNAAGWVAGERWGREVSISQAVMDRIDQEIPMRTSGCRAIREMTKPQALSVWRQFGVTLLGGAPLPGTGVEASLVRGIKRHFLAYRNYETFLDYNCSNAYAVSAGLIADVVATPKTGLPAPETSRR